MDNVTRVAKTVGIVWTVVCVIGFLYGTVSNGAIFGEADRVLFTGDFLKSFSHPSAVRWLMLWGIVAAPVFLLYWYEWEQKSGVSGEPRMQFGGLFRARLLYFGFGILVLVITYLWFEHRFDNTTVPLESMNAAVANGDRARVLNIFKASEQAREVEKAFYLVVAVETVLCYGYGKYKFWQ